MKAWAAILATLLLTGCAAGQGPRDAQAAFLGTAANPAAVIAAELAFARDAQANGQWTAFRRSAAEGAVMFVPEKVDAKAWLKGRADPAEAVRWQPHAVWSSCDGSLAITQGAAQWPDGKPGDFLTVWRRQRDGGYKWILDVGQYRAAPLPAPELIASQVATCRPAVPPAARAPARGVPMVAQGQSDDGTLRFEVVEPANGVVVRAVQWNGSAFQSALTAPFLLK